MKYNERVRHLETHNALNTLWQQCCPQEIRKQFRKMKWVKRAVTGNKDCGSASKWGTVSCAWELQPLGVGGKPANKFERITTECFLWNAEDIYITLSAPLISCAKTEWLSLFSCLKRVIFHHTFQKKKSIKLILERGVDRSLCRIQSELCFEWTLNFLALSRFSDDRLASLSCLSGIHGRKLAKEIQ